MKKKLLLQDFSDLLAASEGLAKKDAETFLRAFFDVIEEGLKKDKFVKIKGLGTFKLVAVSERESVNINTGERFLISGHTKISFTPDTTLKDLVNRPFAHFETVDLSEDTDMTEFETIDREFDEREDVEEPEDETTDEIVSTPELTVRESVVGEEENAFEGETENSRQVEAVAEEKPIEEGGDDTSQDEPSAPVITNVSEIIREEATTTERPTPAESQKAKETESQTEEAVESAVRSESEEKHEKAKEEIIVTSPRSVTAGNEYEGGAVDYTYASTTEIKKRNWWKITAIVLAVVLLMLLSYFAGYYRVLCPCSYPYIERFIQVNDPMKAPSSAVLKTTGDSAKADALPSALSADSLKVSATEGEKKESDVKEEVRAEAKSAPVRQEDTQADDAKEKSQPVVSPAPAAKPTKPVKPAFHVVGRGENLYMISRRYYGTDTYVPALIEKNNLQDADHITIGMKLLLP